MSDKPIYQVRGFSRVQAAPWHDVSLQAFQRANMAGNEVRVVYLQQPAAAPVSGDVALPEPKHRGPDGTGSYFDSYTADQLRTYGQQCSDAALERAAEAIEHKHPQLVGIHRLIRALNGGA